MQGFLDPFLVTIGYVGQHSSWISCLQYCIEVLFANGQCLHVLNGLVQELRDFVLYTGAIIDRTYYLLLFGHDYRDAVEYFIKETVSNSDCSICHEKDFKYFFILVLYQILLIGSTIKESRLKLFHKAY